MVICFKEDTAFMAIVEGSQKTQTKRGVLLWISKLFETNSARYFEVVLVKRIGENGTGRRGLPCLDASIWVWKDNFKERF